MAFRCFPTVNWCVVTLNAEAPFKRERTLKIQRGLSLAAEGECGIGMAKDYLWPLITQIPLHFYASKIFNITNILKMVRFPALESPISVAVMAVKGA